MGNTPFRRGSETITPSESQLYMSQTMYTRAELKLMNKHLKDFERTKRSTPNDLRHMLWHWDQLNVVHKQPTDKTTGVAPIMQLFDVFYCYLFQFAPQMQPLFHNSAQFQGRALMNIVGGIRNLLMSPNVLETAAGIAHRHVLYGVKCEHFNVFGLALMKTLEVLAPTLWTTEVSTAWHNVYAHVAVLVLTRLSRELHQKRGASVPAIAVTTSSLPDPEIPAAIDPNYQPPTAASRPRQHSHHRRSCGSAENAEEIPIAPATLEPAANAGGTSPPTSSSVMRKSKIYSSSDNLPPPESSPSRTNSRRASHATSPEQADLHQTGQETRQDAAQELATQDH